MAVETPTLLSGASALLTGLALTALLVLGYTYITTFVRFQLDVRKTNASSGNETTVPPLMPYAIPGLGSTISFSNQSIGSYWHWLRSQSQRYNRDAFSIILAGTRTHFIYSASAVASMFKVRQLSRARLDQNLGTNVLAMSRKDAVKAFPYDIDEKEKSTTARIHSEHLLSSSAVNALTSKFMECFTNELDGDESLSQGVEVNLYDWLWQRIFRASTTALCGSNLLEMYPAFDKDYRIWEDNMLGLLFGKPRLFARDAYAARDSTVRKLQSWLEGGYRHVPEGDPDWDPYFGARVMRKRHDFYKQQDLSLKGQAGFDLIFLSGILSNATPATGWLLLHILSPTSPPGLKDRIMDELKSAQREDGSVDIPALTRLPYLNSAFHEVLRVYVDLLVVRQVDSGVALDRHYVRQGEQVMAPSWMMHRNPEYFDRPDTFDPERFLHNDTETGKLTYSTSGLSGKYFPFGGGHYMCPGRTFAKQEVLGTVAVLLLNFDISFVEFVKQKGRSYEGVGADQAGFPKPKNNYAGNQVVGIEGDTRVRIKRR